MSQNAIFIIPHYTDGAGLCCWVTESPEDEMSGASGAGYESLAEAVDDMTGELSEQDAEAFVVTDLSDLSAAEYSDLFPLDGPHDKLLQLLDQRAVPLSQWRQHTAQRTRP